MTVIRRQTGAPRSAPPLRVEDGITTRSFQGSGGTNEHFLAIEAPGHLSFGAQIEAIERRYAEAQRALGLTPETAIFRRIFISDAANQIGEIEASRLVLSPQDSPVAVSVIQQPPLPDSKIALQAYHLAGPQPVSKRRLSANQLLVEKNGLGHLWSTRLCAASEAPQVSAEAQTDHVFAELIGTLESQGATLLEHCVRTWIYIKDVDVFYQGVVESRNRLFAKNGLTPDTHYIASTGIEGACPHQFDVVAMDAYSILGLAPEQMSFLNDFSRMCPTHDYHVAFERGTRIAYADRAHHFISGTASIDHKGNVLHRGNVIAQLERTLGNIDAILHSGAGSLADLASIIVYLRDSTDYQSVHGYLAERLPGLPMTIVRGPVCRPDWLIEIEGIAVTANHQPSLPQF